QIRDAFGDVPDHLRDVAGLFALAVDVQPYGAAFEQPGGAARMHGAYGRGLVKRLADFPGTALLLGFALQVAARHVQAKRITPDAFAGLFNGQVFAALAQHQDQLHFVMQVGGLGRVRDGAGLADGHGHQRIGRLGKEERVFAAREAHFFGVLGVVAPDTVHAPHGQQRVTSSHGQRHGRRRRKNVVHVVMTTLLVTHRHAGAARGAPAARPRCGKRASGLLVALGAAQDFFLGGFDALPALYLDPLAFFEVFVVLEEVLDALNVFRGQVFVRLDVAVRRVELVDRHGQQLGVTAGLVVHFEHAQGTAAHHGAHLDGERRDDQHVGGVAIVGQGLGDVAVVARIVHGGQHEAVDEHGAGVLVDFVLDRVGVHGDFDNDIEVIRQLLAG